MLFFYDQSINQLLFSTYNNTMVVGCIHQSFQSSETLLLVVEIFIL